VFVDQVSTRASPYYYPGKYRIQGANPDLQGAFMVWPRAIRHFVFELQKKTDAVWYAPI